MPVSTATAETTTTEPSTTAESVDTEPPAVETEPADGGVVDTYSVEFTGTTEPGPRWS